MSTLCDLNIEDTYLFLAKSDSEGEISAVNWHGKILCIAIRHCKVYLNFNSFTAVLSWILVKHLQVLMIL